MTNYNYHREDIIKEEAAGEAYLYLHGAGIDEPLLLIPYSLISNLRYYYADGLGSIRQLTDYSGTILNQYRYGSWGELNSPFSKSESIHNPFSFTSREFSENSLYFYRFRYYDNKNFISDDLIKYKIINQSSFFDRYILKNFHNVLLASYIYAINNPINYIDPYGTSALRLIKRGSYLYLLYNILMCIIEIKPCEETYYNCRYLHSNIDICIKRGENPSAGSSSHMIEECISRNPACQFEIKYCEKVFRFIYTLGH